MVKQSGEGAAPKTVGPGLMERLITPQGERLVLVDYIAHAFDGS
jgi:hypothetical protein